MTKKQVVAAPLRGYQMRDRAQECADFVNAVIVYVALDMNSVIAVHDNVRTLALQYVSTGNADCKARLEKLFSLDTHILLSKVKHIRNACNMYAASVDMIDWLKENREIDEAVDTQEEAIKIATIDNTDIPDLAERIREFFMP